MTAKRKRKIRRIVVQIRLSLQHKAWLRMLAEKEDCNISGWIRRHIKIAAQCANLEGALTHKQKEELSE